MGFEQRGGRFYYYRKKRQGSKVRSQYVGDALLLGQLGAAEDEAARQNRARQKAVERQVRQSEAEIEASIHSGGD